MSYLRVVPAADIDRIEAMENDVEQPIAFVGKAGQVYPAYRKDGDGLDGEGGFAPVVLHYAINRPAGAQWGESDLAPLLIWLRRYAAWLEDRMRLNRFRNAFIYRVRANFTRRQPDGPGSWNCRQPASRRVRSSSRTRARTGR